MFLKNDNFVKNSIEKVQKSILKNKEMKNWTIESDHLMYQ